MITILRYISALATLLVDAIIFLFPSSVTSFVAGSLHGFARLWDYRIHHSRRNLPRERREALSQADNYRSAEVRAVLPVPDLPVEIVVVTCQDHRHDPDEIDGTTVRNKMKIRIAGGGKALTKPVREGILVGVSKGATEVQLWGHDGCAAVRASQTEDGRALLPETTAAIINFQEQLQLLLSELRDASDHQVLVIVGAIETRTGRKNESQRYWLFEQ